MLQQRSTLSSKLAEGSIEKKTPSGMLGVSKPCGTHVGTFFVLAN